MRLLTLGLWGYRRFEADHGNMDVSEKVVAIVGPNEAGKTSFFVALNHLNGDGPFATNETTRKGNGKVCVRSLYALDDEDRAAITHLAGAKSVTRFHEFKREDGTLHHLVEPALIRDREPRAKLHAARGKILDGRWAKTLEASDREDQRGLVAQFRAATDVLGSSDETLDEAALQALRELASADIPEAPASVATFQQRLGDLASREALPPPDEEARRILAGRTPLFLLFDLDNRALNSAHEITEGPSEALINLLNLAELDIDELRAAVASGDQSLVEEIEDAANKNLKRRFSEAWTQSATWVRLRVDATELHVLASNKPGSFLPIADRSDGVRQFVALFAYVERYNDRPVKPILLVDEAENHLHYDAQADLVRAFTRQKSAAKVLYTTHSAGCLPQDLGNGVRLIEPIGPADQPRDTWDRSRIRNWFWTEGPGFAPLLIGMGASALAFSATRKALMVEGIVDAMLLPTLFREATGKDDVGFQVAPSLAEITPEAAEEVDLVAARVAYLLDGDKGGLGHRGKLVDAGIPVDRILLLEDSAGQPLAVEELLDEGVYRQAVNLELARKKLEFPDSDAIPANGRAAFIKKWCEKQTDSNGDPHEAPTKRSVAQRVLEERFDRANLDPARQELVAKLHQDVTAILNLPSHATSA
jgi:predicted ATP-dependent endonuclease of OLD family